MRAGGDAVPGPSGWDFVLKYLVVERTKKERNMMTIDKNKMVSIEEAAAQVKIVATRLALMHMAYARTVVAELGDKKGKKTVLKAMMEYGRMVGERTRKGEQDLPFYGLHEKYSYGKEEFLDTREMPADQSEEMDWDEFKVYGCVLSRVFQEYGEEELGVLYCYVDAAKTMATGSAEKLIHTACEVCGDDHCAFSSVAATDLELRMFEKKDPDWQDVDPLLVKGIKS
jgi:hypothetical protein